MPSRITFHYHHHHYYYYCCYDYCIDQSFPALLFFASKYADSTERALLANANGGGENVGRGSCLGALLGAANGVDSFPEWSHELYHKHEINDALDTFQKSM